MNEWIFSLAEPESQDRSLSGGKAANLAALATSFRVPAGFVITATAHEAVKSTPNAARAIQTAINDAYHLLCQQADSDRVPVAVRSSALDEDGDLTSFAGIHESYLNQRGEDAIWQAVQACWQSAISDRALTYRQQHDLPQENISMAVLVQQLVPADVSAVAFSYDPVAGQADTIVINANWGLGESIVGGSVTPDSHRINKNDLQLLEQFIAHKQQMTITIEGGTNEVRVPGMMQKSACLTESQVIAIARMTRVLEQRQGWPVDIECAYAADDLYLLQCRPVTGIS